MTKAELIERIARSRDLPPNVTKKEIALILGVAFEELATYFARARVTRASSPRFTFPHFGTFTKKRRSARRGVNPRTLQPMEIEAFDTVDFKASKELRESMNPVGPASPSRSARRAKGPKPAGTAAKGAPKPRTRKAAAAAKGRRPLTRRDEVELDALIEGRDGSGDGPATRERAAAELPPARMQRVEAADANEPRPRVRSRNLR